MALQNNQLKDAVKAATKNRTSASGPLRPALTDGTGRISLLTAGEGITLSTMRTGKVGGGKSVTAYALTSPRDSIDRQLSQGRYIEQLLEASENPIVLPLVMSIGGTSFDAYLALLEAPGQNFPAGAFQYITTTPQDRLPFDVAVAASRKKLESLAALTCIDSGDSINEVPVVLLNMGEEANAKFVESEHLRLVMEAYSGLQPAMTYDRSDVVVKLEEHSRALGKGCNEAKLFITDEEHPKGGERLKIQHETYTSPTQRTSTVGKSLALETAKTTRLNWSRSSRT